MADLFYHLHFIQDSNCFSFRPLNTPISSILPSFWLGFQYDAKWIAVILLPIALLSVHPKFSPFYSEKINAGGHITWHLQH